MLSYKLAVEMSTNYEIIRLIMNLAGTCTATIKSKQLLKLLFEFCD